jgi:UDP-N-acetylmuramyl tripeptide synthase
VRILALVVGKFVLLLGRVLGKRGSSFPGLVVEKLYPGFLAASLARLPDGVIVVSGTNGKTTTVKMITEVIATQQRVLTNRTGANFTRGIISSILMESSWTGRLPHTIAVFEVDEAWAARMVREIKPRGAVITNVMRDQMDRFGEIDHTARLLGEVVAAAQGFVVLNADDPRVRRMAEAAAVPVTYFGVGVHLRKVFISDDELYLEDIDVAASQASRPQPDFVLERIAPGSISVSAHGQPREIALQVFGSHNAQNATAALAVGDCVGVPLAAAAGALEHMEAAFGRGEFIELNGQRLLLQLVKNPGGFRYSLMDVGTLSPAEVLIAINDDYADGRDVSWLWDVDFRSLAAWPVSTTGTRAEDMALRLEYDGVPVATCDTDMRRAVAALSARHPAGSTLVVCATYTAMFDLRAILSTMTEVAAI